jgi:hypothetical protein
MRIGRVLIERLRSRAAGNLLHAGWCRLVQGPRHPVRRPGPPARHSESPCRDSGVADVFGAGVMTTSATPSSRSIKLAPLAAGASARSTRPKAWRMAAIPSSLPRTSSTCSVATLASPSGLPAGSSTARTRTSSWSGSGRASVGLPINEDPGPTVSRAIRRDQGREEGPQPAW